MTSLQIVPAASNHNIQSIAELASIVWNEHFTSILSQEQIDYMIDKFQSYEAIQKQIADGYEYFMLKHLDTLIGYTGICAKDDSLFLSKLYIRKDYRGLGFSSKTFQYLKNLCQTRSLKRIWLTCNKYNFHSLDVYKHFHFNVIDTQKADIGGGFIMDDYIMEYKL